MWGRSWLGGNEVGVNVVLGLGPQFTSGAYANEIDYHVVCRTRKAHRDN